MSAEVRDRCENLRNQGLPTASRRCSYYLTVSPAPISSRPSIGSRRPAAAGGFDPQRDQASTSQWTARPRSRASLHDVSVRLLIAVALVVLVVFVFLRNLRATLIPSVAVPVSLIGTFGAMYLLGYSLNNLVPDGADDLDRLRGRRCDRGAGKRDAAYRSRQCRACRPRCMARAKSALPCCR